MICDCFQLRIARPLNVCALCCPATPQGVDTSGPETKGTVLITSAEELTNYSRSEEDKLESYIKARHCSILVAANDCNS